MKRFLAIHLSRLIATALIMAMGALVLSGPSADAISVLPAAKAEQHDEPGLMEVR